VGRPSLEELMKAAARLGDAVVDPREWPNVMGDMSRAVRAEGAALIQSDLRTPRSPRVSKAFDVYFRDSWHALDVRALRALPLILRGQPVVIDQDIFSSPEEMSKQDQYNELSIPSGLQWWAVVGFGADGKHWGISFHRTIRQGPFDQQDKRTLAQISQRLSEAATLSQAVSRAALTGAVNALNLMRQPAAILDRFGRVLDTNAMADQMFESEIHISHRRLTVTDRRARAELERLGDALRAAGDATPLPSDPIVVRRHEKPPVLIRVLPIEPAARCPFLGARALLMMLDLSDHRPPPPRLLAASFGLTAAEAKLAALVGAGETIERAAERLGISIHTAKTQLKSVFGKTETHRQAELAALVARLRGVP
jgi:DNA-binding CsgD family transcriptional regulator